MQGGIPETLMYWHPPQLCQVYCVMGQNLLLVLEQHDQGHKCSFNNANNVFNSLLNILYSIRRIQFHMFICNLHANLATLNVHLESLKMYKCIKIGYAI